MRQKSKENSSISGHKRLEEHYTKRLQPEKDKYCIVLLICGTDSIMVFVGAGGGQTLFNRSACQAPLSMAFPRQEHWSGSPLFSRGFSQTKD